MTLLKSVDPSAGSVQSRVTEELHFSRRNGVVDETIDRLLDMLAGIRHRDIVREMLLTALKAGMESDFRADLKLMNTTLKEMRYTTKVFAPYRCIRKVTVFGSARTRAEAPAYQLACELGRRLAEEGHMVITGGGGGIMQAVNEGAGPEHSFGVKIKLPFEANANHVLTDNSRLINYKYFFNRKVAFIKEADAVVLLPGGFGTLDEAMEIITLVQTGKCPPLPLLFLEPPGGTYWSSKVEFLRRELLDCGYIDPADLDLFTIVNAAEDVIALIDRFYCRYHSMRFVGERLVIRLKEALPDERVARLQEDFSDLLQPQGCITLAGALPEEANETQLQDLPRLIIDFNRRDCGRLCHLIDAINAD
jgi:uncharacterized protein (TIGR00730 family)